MAHVSLNMNQSLFLHFLPISTLLQWRVWWALLKTKWPALCTVPERVRVRVRVRTRQRAKARQPGRELKPLLTLCLLCRHGVTCLQNINKVLSSVRKQYMQAKLLSILQKLALEIWMKSWVQGGDKGIKELGSKLWDRFSWMASHSDKSWLCVWK